MDVSPRDITIPSVPTERGPGPALEEPVVDVPLNLQGEDMLTRAERGVRRLERVVWLLVFALALLVANTALAQSNCLPRPVMFELFRTHEVTIADWGTANGNLVEWWGSPDSGKWFVISTNTHNISCIIASGKNFERIEKLAPVQKDG